MSFSFWCNELHMKVLKRVAKQKQMQTSTQRMDKKATSYHIAQGTLFNALHDKPEWKSI